MEGEGAEDVVAAGGAEGVEVLVWEAGGQEMQLRRAEEGLDALHRRGPLGVAKLFEPPLHQTHPPLELTGVDGERRLLLLLTGFIC